MGFVILGYYINNKDFNLSPKTMFIFGLLIYFIFTLFNALLRIFGPETGDLIERRGLIVVLQSCGIFLFI